VPPIRLRMSAIDEKSWLSTAALRSLAACRASSAMFAAPSAPCASKNVFTPVNISTKCSAPAAVCSPSRASILSRTAPNVLPTSFIAASNPDSSTISGT
ncbi:uncharacterized protein METZ01_LOCUS7806, partial [marine metagenome]